MDLKLQGNIDQTQRDGGGQDGEQQTEGADEQAHGRLR